MNYMKQVAEMLGVEVGEKFDIKYENGDITADCVIDENSIRGIYDSHIDLFCGLVGVLCGKDEIIKKPFRPELGEKYWCIIWDADIRELEYDGATFDLMAMYMGNCFRTEAEAEAHKDEIMAKFREVMGDA